MAYSVTDEIFGVSVGQKILYPYYSYGVTTFSVLGWTMGTFLGVISGQILPARVISALSLALYGMFLAIIIPPARENKILAWLIFVSMGASLLSACLPVISELSSGARIIILTVVISLIAAVLFPIEEEPAKDKTDKGGDLCEA